MAVIEAIQFGVLALLAIVVGRLGRLTVGPVVGTVAAVLCVSYLPFIWLTSRYLTEVLASFLMTVVIVLLIRARRSNRPVTYPMSGLALALLTYVRPEFVLMVVPIALILLLHGRGSWWSRSRWQASLTFTVVFVVALVPWTIRNASVTGGRLLPMAATSGSDLLASADQYSGLLSYNMTDADWRRYELQAASIAPVPVQDLDARGQVQADDRLRAAALRIVKRLSFLRVITSVPKRVAYLWGPADLPPAGKYASIAHRLAQLQEMALAVLGAIGLVIRRRQLLGDWPLWIAAAYLTVIHLVAHIEGRYSLPARPGLLIYAAVGVCAIAGFLSRRARLAGDSAQAERVISPQSGQ